MKPRTCRMACTLAALLLQGCGWKMVEMPIRVEGQVLEADTRKPVEGAIIDISDDRENLDLALTTNILTDQEGKFDTLYRYSYEKWIWFGLPVYWFPKTPERLYVETSKNGFQTRIKQIDYRALETKQGKTAVPVDVDTVLLQKKLSAKKSRQRKEE
ncbi:MAG: hypothetical protein NTZ78_13850 [Candidatus Aureabacteria bacterium]|nr:hypothetical protein [Candidatus Auribacterota bacterium]